MLYLLQCGILISLTHEPGLGPFELACHHPFRRQLPGHCFRLLWLQRSFSFEKIGFVFRVLLASPPSTFKGTVGFPGTMAIKGPWIYTCPWNLMVPCGLRVLDALPPLILTGTVVMLLRVCFSYLVNFQVFRFFSRILVCFRFASVSGFYIWICRCAASCVAVRCCPYHLPCFDLCLCPIDQVCVYKCPFHVMLFYCGASTLRPRADETHSTGVLSAQK